MLGLALLLFLLPCLLGLLALLQGFTLVAKRLLLARLLALVAFIGLACASVQGRYQRAKRRQLNCRRRRR